VNDYTVKEVIEQFVQPQLQEIKMRQSQIETEIGKLLEEGSPWGREQVQNVIARVDANTRRINEVVEKILTPDGVSNLIAQALKDNQATGIDTRERRIRYAAFGISALVFLIQIVSLVLYAKYRG